MSEDRLICRCGTPLGDGDNPNWVVYPNPCICPQCGEDNSPRVLQHAIEQAKKGRKRR